MVLGGALPMVAAEVVEHPAQWPQALAAVVLVALVELLQQQQAMALQVQVVVAVVPMLVLQPRVGMVAMGLRLSDTQEHPLELVVLPGLQAVTPTTSSITKLLRKR